MSSPRIALTARLACLVLVLPVASGDAAAQEKQPPVQAKQIAGDLPVLAAGNSWGVLFLAAAAQIANEERHRQAFWDSPRIALAAASAELVTEFNPFTRLLLRKRGWDLAVWHERRDEFDSAPELDRSLLLAVRDGTGMPDFRGKAPDLRRKSEQAVYDAYCQAVFYAHITPLPAFEKSADDFKHVTFAHLWNEFKRMKKAYEEKHFDEENQYRGKVLRVQGELLRLRKWDAPKKLLERGVPFVYEGWIKGPTKDSFPFVVILPDPVPDKFSPTGVLEPSEDLKRSVVFYGYFFKMTHYPVQHGTGDKVRTEERDSPMLIGPTLILEGEPPPAVAVNPMSRSSCTP